METSLRFGGDSKALRIHAKEKLPIDSNTYLQVLALYLSFSSFVFKFENFTNLSLYSANSLFVQSIALTIIHFISINFIFGPIC